MDYVCGNCGADVAEDDCCPCYEGIDTSVPEFLRDLAFVSISPPVDGTATLDYCAGGCGRMTQDGTRCAECQAIRDIANYWAYRQNDLVRTCYDCERNPCICGDIFPFANIRHADGKVYDCNGGLLEDHGRRG